MQESKQLDSPLQSPNKPTNESPETFSSQKPPIEAKLSSKKREIQSKTPAKDLQTSETLQRLNNKSPTSLIPCKELIETLKFACKSSMKKKAEENTENKENKPSKKTEKIDENQKKTPMRIDAKKEVEVSDSKMLKSIGKVAVFYHKCGLCKNNMIIGKEKTKLLSCAHRFHEDCLGGKIICFLCQSQEAYDPRPCEKSLKELPIN